VFSGTPLGYHPLKWRGGPYRLPVAIGSDRMIFTGWANWVWRYFLATAWWPAMSKVTDTVILTAEKATELTGFTSMQVSRLRKKIKDESQTTKESFRRESSGKSNPSSFLTGWIWLSVLDCHPPQVVHMCTICPICLASGIRGNQGG